MTQKDPYKYFRIEGRELLEGLSRGILELGRGDGDRQVVGGLLRLAHTLKGASRVVKLTNVASLAHAMEDALAPHRDDDAAVPQATVDGLLALLDAMSAELAAIALDAARAATGAATPAREALASVRVELDEMDRLIEAVTEATVLAAALRRETEGVEYVRRAFAALMGHLGSRATHAAASAPTDVKTRLLEQDVRAALDRLQGGVAAGVEQVTRELAQIRDAADRLRLVPVSAMFGPLERAVRDVGQAMGKEVVFATSGGDGRVDANVLGALRDALTHVVRNAVAHGIEPPGARIAAGKPAGGQVTLRVERRGSRIAFACDDDGAGLDVEALRRAAVRAGVVAANESRALPEPEVLRLLLKGGLTTTGSVTEVSGRGIGLDVVRDAATRLSGEVRIESRRGVGTTVEITVPLSLSSLSGLLVEAAGVVAVLPIDSVRESLRLLGSDINRSPDGASIAHQGLLLPFVPLAAALRLPIAVARERRHWSAVVVRSGPDVAAVGVDRLLGTARVVVRPLPSMADVDPIVAGACFDGEGTPQLVLDPARLVAATRHGPGGRQPSQAPVLPVLVVDDSLTTRMLEQSILESAGYVVELATSGEDALAKAAGRRFGLFVVDVEMPGMDGFEFVARARSSPELRDTPAILVTSRGSPEDRKRGEDVGAKAYVVKGEFDQNYLLAKVRLLLGDGGP